MLHLHQRSFKIRVQSKTLHNNCHFTNGRTYLRWISQCEVDSFMFRGFLTHTEHMHVWTLTCQWFAETQTASILFWWLLCLTVFQWLCIIVALCESELNIAVIRHRYSCRTSKKWSKVTGVSVFFNGSQQRRSHTPLLASQLWPWPIEAHIVLLSGFEHWLLHWLQTTIFIFIFIFYFFGTLKPYQPEILQRDMTCRQTYWESVRQIRKREDREMILSCSVSVSWCSPSCAVMKDRLATHKSPERLRAWGAITEERAASALFLHSLLLHPKEWHVHVTGQTTRLITNACEHVRECSSWCVICWSFFFFFFSVSFFSFSVKQRRLDSLCFLPIQMSRCGFEDSSTFQGAVARSWVTGFRRGLEKIWK